MQHHVDAAGLVRQHLLDEVAPVVDVTVGTESGHQGVLVVGAGGGDGRAGASRQQLEGLLAHAAGRPGDQQANDLAFSDVILAPGLGTELFRAHSTRALAASRLLAERAKAAGAIRADFDLSDLFLLQQANAGLVKSVHRSAPRAWKRLGQYMLQAFRVDGGALEPSSPTWTRAAAAGSGGSKQRPA